MQLLRHVLPIALALGFFATSSLSADECIGDREPFHNDALQRDFFAVQDFINSKRTIPIEEKENNLTISGDVRTEWANIVEKIDGERLRGSDGIVRDNDEGIPVISDEGVPYSTNAFNIAFNLYVDYVCDRSWAVAWVQFRNIAGVEQNRRLINIDDNAAQGSGCCDNLCLKKAYVGYNICADGGSRFDVELGRRPLYTVFDSRIQFQARFDGLLLKYARGFECWADWYVNAGGFVVDERVNHFAWVAETGLLNLMDCGFDLKYSYIDWEKHGRNAFGARNPDGWRYRNSQIVACYHLCPDVFCTEVKLYGATLWNHAAHHKKTETGYNLGRQNFAWYAGFTLGQLCTEGDWAFDFNYQWVEAYAIPDPDISGISNGNLLGETIINTSLPLSERRGRGNYKGWRAEAAYNLTSNLTLDTFFELSRTIQKRLGGAHNYSRFEVQAIYAF